jgi:hypothetical protein
MGLVYLVTFASDDVGSKWLSIWRVHHVLGLYIMSDKYGKEATFAMRGSERYV